MTDSAEHRSWLGSRTGRSGGGREKGAVLEMRPWEGTVVWVVVSLPVAMGTGGVLAAVRKRAARSSVTLPDPSTVVLAADPEAADAES